MNQRYDGSTGSLNGDTSWLMVTLIVWSIVNGACVPARSRSSVTGVYEMSAAAQTITLDVSPQGTFTETLVLGPNETQRRTGTWQWEAGRIGFSDLWIPESFAPEYIRRADAAAGAGQHKYTQPGYWSITAENHWGTTTLPIFPDADVSFKMVKRH